MRKLVTLLFVLAIVLGFITIYNFKTNSEFVSFVLSPNSTGLVGFTIVDPNLVINITNPINNTIYNFSIPEYLEDRMNLTLNVTANAPTQNWWYTLEDLHHLGLIIANNSIFTPNTTISVSRWENRLTVWANDSGGREGNQTIEFYVNVSNIAPVLEPLRSEVLICEGETLNEGGRVSYPINSKDYDEDNMQFFIETTGPFFIGASVTNNLLLDSFNFPPWYMFASGKIVSPVLTNLDAGNGSTTYEINVSVGDGTFSDRNSTNITVIEINDAPVILNGIVGPVTLWTKGDNTTLYKNYVIYDEEDLNEFNGVSYGVNFSPSVNLFTLDSGAIINFTAGPDNLGVGETSVNYLVTVNFTDKGIISRHPKIVDECNQTGGPIVTQNIFWLTITNNNRIPIIKKYNPTTLNFSVSDGDAIYLNLTSYDPDGTNLTTLWYVDGTFVENDTLSLFAEFNYAFECGIGGNHNISARVTDGLNFTTLAWNISVQNIACPVNKKGGGGGGGGDGGGGGNGCTPDWMCHPWQVCENIGDSLRSGDLIGESYRLAKINCVKMGLFEESDCGIQHRECSDLNECDNNHTLPNVTQSCEYSINPSCDDGIKNCHDGACEFLIDCGGTCGACATCNDGIQNQGEERIDCGGPCIKQCPLEIPRIEFNFKLFIWIVVGLVLFTLIIYLVIKGLNLRKKINSQNRFKV